MVKRKLDLPEGPPAKPSKLAALPIRVVRPYDVNTKAFAGFDFAAASSDRTAGDGSAPGQHSAANLGGDNLSSDFAAPGPAPDAPKKVQPSGGMFEGHLVINLDDEPDLPAAAEAPSSQGMTTRRGANNTSSAPRAAGNDAVGKYNVTVPMQFVMTEETKKYYEKTDIHEIQHAVMTSIKSLIDSKKLK